MHHNMIKLISRTLPFVNYKCPSFFLQKDLTFTRARGSGYSSTQFLENNDIANKDIEL